MIAAFKLRMRMAGPMALRMALLLVWMLAAAAAKAQTTGVISGTVTDKAGAVVPGVQVAARNIASGEIRTAVTNSVGEYSFPALAPGDYTITFTVQGFSTIVETATLNVTEHIAVNTTMQVGNVSTTVEVTSAQPLLQTESVTQGGVINGAEMRQLPLATNNFTQLLALSPGVVGSLNSATGLGRGTQNVNVNGARTNSNSIYIDGVDAVNVHVNSAANNAFASNGSIIPPTEAIQEVKIQTALFDATTGRAGGSNVAVITRTGTNAFHGSLYEFFRNTALNANEYFLKQQGQRRPQLNQNQFGASIGGPVLKNKLFFFFNYQGTRQINGFSGITSVVLPQIPQDRSAASLGAYGTTLGATSYTGPVVTAANINPVAVALLNLKLPNGNYVIPSPQTANTAGVNYAATTNGYYQEDEYTGSADYQLTSKDHVAFHAIVSQQPQLQAVASKRYLPGFALNQLFKSRLYSVAATHIFSSNVVNDFHFGLNRSIGSTGFSNPIPLSSIGMSRFNSATFADIPLIELSSSFEIGYSVNADQADTENTWQYFDNVSWLKGKHSMNFGVEMRRYQDTYFSNYEMRGALDFISIQNLLLGENGVQNGTGHSDVYESTVGSGVVQRYDRLRDVGLFVQDSWKPVSRVTVNLGLRWEYFGLPTDIYGRDGAFDTRRYQGTPNTGSTSIGFVQAGNARNPVPGIAKVSDTLTDTVGKFNFAPRLGVSVRMNSRQVLRAGYGLFYDRLSNQLGLLESLSLPNFVATSSVNTSKNSAYNNTTTLANPFPTLPLQNQFPVLPVLYGAAATTTQAPIAFNDVDPMIRTPYYQQFGANIQTQITQGLLLEIGYVGSNGRHLPIQKEINQALIASPSNPVNGITTNNTGTTDTALARAPYVGFSNNGLAGLQTSTTSNFNSAQVTLTERLGAAQLLASYMYSKSLDTNSGSTDGAVFNTLSGDQTNQAQAYGPSDFNRTNHFVARFVQPVPTAHFGLARGKIGSRIFNRYEFSGTGVLQSGTPFSVTSSSAASYYGTDTSRASFAPGYTAAQVPGTGRTESRLVNYYNAAAIVGGGTLYGNTPRNFLAGPFQRDLDLSLTKYTPLRDNIVLEFRAQAFNLTNTPNFANPSGDSSSSPATITSTTGNPRILQFVLKLTY